jgi:hypothetical protein
VRNPLNRLAVAAIATLALLAIPAGASAAASGNALVRPQGANAWSGVTLTLARLDGSGAPVLLVTADLRPEGKEPLNVALPVPHGAKVTWTGEITGNDPSKDIKRPFGTMPGSVYDLARSR